MYVSKKLTVPDGPETIESWTDAIRCLRVTTGKDDFPEAVGLVIAYAEGGFVGALDFWRTTSIDHEHLITALAAISVFLAAQTGSATGQSLEQVLAMLWAWRLVAPWKLMAPFWAIQDLVGLLPGHLKSLLLLIDAGTDDLRSSTNQSVFPSHPFILR